MVEFFEPPPYFPKQQEALNALAIDHPATDILFGGGKGCAKSSLGCRWQIERRLKYAGSKSIIGRSSLKELKKSTIPTLLEWLAKYNLKSGRDWDFNWQDMVITFFNGSEIHFFDLFDYPSDADFQRFGGIEIMDFFIDEAGEVSRKCFNILKTLCRKGLRDFCGKCGHHEPRTDFDEYWTCKACGELTSGLPIKGFMGCNPVKGWLYDDFYFPNKSGKILKSKAFIPALATDNPALPKAYIEELRKLPEYDRKRLLEGDWEYDESKDRIYEYNDLLIMCDAPEAATGEMFTTADIGAMGEDPSIIGVWKGLTLLKVYVFIHKLPHEIAEEIKKINQDHGVGMQRTVVDSDGLGIGVYGILKCKQFLNGSSAIDKERYENLRSQCYFKLADLVRLNKIKVQDRESAPVIVKELDAIRRKNMDKEGKLGIIPRDQIIRILGHSPDYASMIMMRMIFELRPNYGKYSWA